jgi:hypothetical protein
MIGGVNVAEKDLREALETLVNQLIKDGKATAEAIIKAQDALAKKD